MLIHIKKKLKIYRGDCAAQNSNVSIGANNLTFMNVSDNSIAVCVPVMIKMKKFSYDSK
jgi:hypothetical protein